MWSTRSILLTFVVLCIVMINGDPLKPMPKTAELPIGAYDEGCMCGAVGHHCGSRVATGQLHGLCSPVLYECLVGEKVARYIGDCTIDGVPGKCTEGDFGQDKCNDPCMCGRQMGKHCGSRVGTYLSGTCKKDGYYYCESGYMEPAYHSRDCPEGICFTDNGTGRDICP
ncbi:unnamed protein product [Oppiella nova]|uniref:Uncharacterized protein n=1 Tax=Oppiella nova TaxID=334625 RepID=A0A7R9M7S9_9ACAR|nr:unnamed protein product [Oppiella nova]CAG2172339.1 unnamed protein product [Oppiella nova]